jgi:hypothetical protein
MAATEYEALTAIWLRGGTTNASPVAHRAAEATSSKGNPPLLLSPNMLANHPTASLFSRPASHAVLIFPSQAHLEDEGSSSHQQKPPTNNQPHPGPGHDMASFSSTRRRKVATVVCKVGANQSRSRISRSALGLDLHSGCLEGEEESRRGKSRAKRGVGVHTVRAHARIQGKRGMKAGFPEPPPPRECAFVGLINQGSTCYLNSLLQVGMLAYEYGLQSTTSRRGRHHPLQQKQALTMVAAFPCLPQTCFMIPEFRGAILSVRGDDIDYAGPLCEEGGLDIEASKPGDEPLFMPLELQRLFAYMQAADVRALSTRALTRSFGWDGSEVQVQHDIHELSR